MTALYRSLPVLLVALASSLLAATAGAQTWNESGEAGQTLATANITTGSGPLTRINGSFPTASSDADIYAIRITNRAAFSATTVGQTTLDTQLFLFDSNGKGVTFDDDTASPAVSQSTITSQFVPAAGLYYLAISQYNYKPQSAAGAIWLDTPFATERAPDGPGAAGVLSTWSGAATAAGGVYGINLTGATFAVDTAGPSCPPNLAPIATFSAGAGPTSVAVGDFNRDGRLDLAISNTGGGNNIGVLFGNGDGTFQPAVFYPVGSGTFSVVTGDFNRDGKLDLAVAKFTGGVAIFLGNGDGTFQAAVPYAAGTNVSQVAAGDVNGDGKLDLVVLNGSSILSTVSVLLGNGDGTFQAGATGNLASDSRAIVLADLNGDGKLDIASADAGVGLGTTVSVALGNGNGTFQSPVTYAAGSEPYAIAVGDVNGDGRSDLIVADLAGNNVSVLLGNGNGSFQAAVNFPAGAAPQSVAVGDFNGDGKLDIAAGNNSGNTLSILLGNGDGTFQAPVSVAAGGLPFSISLADVNRDGLPDFVIADNNNGGNTPSVAVLLHLPGAPTPTITTNPASQTVLTGAWTTLTVAATSTSGTPTYQWRRNGQTFSGPDYTGTTSPTLTFLHLALSDNAAYDCVVSNSCGSTTSSPASLTVNYRCRPDYNQNGAIDVQDIFDFLAAWFAGCP